MSVSQVHLHPVATASDTQVLPQKTITNPSKAKKLPNRSALNAFVTPQMQKPFTGEED